MNLLKAALITLAALNLMDMGISACLLGRYGAEVEVNLLMQALWRTSPAIFIVCKAMLSAVLVFAALRLRALRKWLCYAVVPTAAVYACVVGWSLFVLFTAG